MPPKKKTNTHPASNLLAHATVDLFRVPGSALRQRNAAAAQLLHAIGQIQNGQRVNVGPGNFVNQILDVVLTVKPDRRTKRGCGSAKTRKQNKRNRIRQMSKTTMGVNKKHNRMTDKRVFSWEGAGSIDHSLSLSLPSSVPGDRTR